MGSGFDEEGPVLRDAAHAQQFLSQESFKKQTTAKGQMLHVFCVAQPEVIRSGF